MAQHRFFSDIKHFTGSLALGIALMLASAGAQAHPHAWIDVRSTIVMTDNGMISAVEQTWLFDELYSLAVLSEMGTDTPNGKLDVSDFAAQVIKNLGPYNYFMLVTADGRPVDIGNVTQFKSEMKGQQLMLSFTAPLAQPLDPRDHATQLAVYDPTYFIQMKHLPEDPPKIKSRQPSGCQTQVVQPDPSQEAIERAFSLDRGETPEDNLGDLFAEKVHIQCK